MLRQVRVEKKAFPEASSKGFEWGFCPYGGSRGQRERDLEFLSFRYTHDEKNPRNLTRVSTLVSMSIMQYLPVFPSLVIACPSFPTSSIRPRGLLDACLPVNEPLQKFYTSTISPQKRLCSVFLSFSLEKRAYSWGNPVTRAEIKEWKKRRKRRAIVSRLACSIFPCFQCSGTKLRGSEEPRRCSYVGNIWRTKLSLAYLLSSLHLRTFSPPTKASPKIRKDSA